MTETSESPTYCRTEREILNALLYFEIFSHPLTAAEVCHFSNCPSISPEETLQKLQSLAMQGAVFRFGKYFATKNRPDWVSQRETRNERADGFLPKARRMAKFIGGFPLVRGVFVSGSLSKHCMSEDSDVDFFIVTQPERLWLARTLLVLFKKIFLFNSHKYFCVNYFVDSEHLEIEEKNIFTALETVTLLPMFGSENCARFQAANTWAKRFFPNFPPRNLEGVPADERGFLKKSLEFLFGGWLGEQLDLLSMRLTVGYWRRKFPQFDENTFNVALKSRRHVSKHHPLYFQQKVLTTLAEKQAAFFGKA